MKIGKLSALIMVVLMAWVLSAGAEEKHGIRMYAAATYDAATTKTVSDSLSLNAACYRTNDPVSKVVAFFRTQPGLEYLGGDKDNALFRKGTIDVTVQSPWMDMRTGSMMKDTLITVVKQ